MEDKYLELLQKLYIKNQNKKDVPVAALIVKNDKIIAKSVNTREKSRRITAHAEINCIEKANKRLKNWNLSGCDMYVTLKPCSMCASVIQQSRLNNVYYLLDKPISKQEYSKTKIIKLDNNSYEEEYQKILSNFFKKLRKRK